MKKFNYVITTALLGSILVGPAVLAAETPAPANSKADITFTENTDKTPPEKVDPTDPENPGTGNPGPLSIDYVPNLKFGEHKVTGAIKTYNVTNVDPFIQVTDKTGNKAGWNVTVESSDFKNGDKVLANAELSFTSGIVEKAKEPTATGKPLAKDVVSMKAKSSQPIFDAAVGDGVGTWLDSYTVDPLPAEGEKVADNGKITLKTFGDEAIGTYTADLTWTLAAGPHS